STYVCFRFHTTATSDLDPPSLHDALPICWTIGRLTQPQMQPRCSASVTCAGPGKCRSSMRRSAASSMLHASDGLTVRRSSFATRSEEHTSELQSLRHLVCRLLLEKKKMKR